MWRPLARPLRALLFQIARPFRKPLIVAAPKTLLRLQAATSPLSDMGPGTAFQPVLPDPMYARGGAQWPSVRRVVLVSGKLYYELAKRRAELIGSGALAKEGAPALVRVEELCPFPSELLRGVLADFPEAQARSMMRVAQWCVVPHESRLPPSQVVWCQEEPANAGAWAWAEAHLAPVLREAGRRELLLVGRPALAAPAVGLSKMSKGQQDFLIDAALL